MVALTIQEIFFEEWFWWIIWIPLLIAIYFLRRKHPLPPPKPSSFFIKHKETIKKITDVGLICIVLIGCLLLLPFPIIQIFHSLNEPKEIRATDLHFAWSSLLMSLITVSGHSSMFIGFLSVFHQNLTKHKRIFLLSICLLPIAFTALELLTGMVKMPWTTIRICIYNSTGSWIVNAPAIFLGKHFFPVSWNIMRKLNFASGDYPE